MKIKMEDYKTVKTNIANHLKNGYTKEEVKEYTRILFLNKIITYRQHDALMKIINNWG